MPGFNWTNEEIEIIKYNYPRYRVSLWRHLLPNRTTCSISAKSVRLGVKKQECGQRAYVVNDNYFSNINNISSYWAGFLAADGYVRNGHDLGVGVRTIDLEHIEKLQKEIAPKKPICHSNNVVSLVIRSKSIVTDLYNIYNITQKKSLTLCPPNITDKYLSYSFISGLFDGDGTVRKNGRSLCFLGTKQMMEWIQSILNCKEYLKPDNNIYELVISSNYVYNYIEFIRFSNLPILRRKWNKIFSYMSVSRDVAEKRSRRSKQQKDNV